MAWGRFAAAGLVRFFRNKSSQGLAFPHQKSCQDNDRKVEISKKRGVWLNHLRRTINITDQREAEENVNPAKNRTFGVWVHDVVMVNDDIGYAPNYGRSPSPRLRQGAARTSWPSRTPPP